MKTPLVYLLITMHPDFSKVISGAWDTKLSTKEGYNLYINYLDYEGGRDVSTNKEAGQYKGSAKKSYVWVNMMSYSGLKTPLCCVPLRGQ